MTERRVVEDEILIVIQVNGKLRDRIMVPASYGEKEIKEWALKSERIQKLIEGKRDQAGGPGSPKAGQYRL